MGRNRHQTSGFRLQPRGEGEINNEFHEGRRIGQTQGSAPTISIIRTNCKCVILNPDLRQDRFISGSAQGPV